MLKEITFVTQYFAPAWGYGGPPKILYTLAKELIKRGIKVNVVTTDVLDEGRNKSLKEVLDKIEIFRYRTLSNYAAYKTKLIFAPQILSHSKEIIKRSDLVLFSDLRAIINWQIYPYVIKRNIPYGIFAFGEIPYGDGIKSIIKKIFDAVWVHNFIINAKWLFAQTEHEKEMYKLYFGISGTESDLFPLPVDKIIKKPVKKQVEQLKKKLNITNNDKLITFIGRINYLKGIDILINAIEDLLHNDRNIKILIVGRDDGYLDSLLKLIPKDIKAQVIFTGPLYGIQARLIYCISSCFSITPRFYEETSSAAVEALSYGVPVVVTKETDIPFLSDYQGGFVVENNASAISDAIRKILYCSIQEKKQMGLEALRCIQDHFMVGKVTTELLQILTRN